MPDRGRARALHAWRVARPGRGPATRCRRRLLQPRHPYPTPGMWYTVLGARAVGERMEDVVPAGIAQDPLGVDRESEAVGDALDEEGAAVAAGGESP